ncbi:hypothetical protein NBRC116495_07070 [Aurantivibrio plasticivorans]
MNSLQCYMPGKLSLRLATIVVLLLSLSRAPLIGAAEYIVGVETINYKPYYYLENGEYHGFARELFDGFSQYSGHSFTFRPLPINRLYEEFRNEKIDFKFPDNPNWGSDEKRGLRVLYSHPVVGFIDGVLTLSSRDCENAPLKSLGYVRGFTPWPYLPEIESKKLKAVQVNALESLLKMVKAGRIEAAFVNISVAHALMKDMRITKDELSFSEGCPHDASNYLLSTKQYSDVVTQFNEYLASSKVATLRSKYNLQVNE